MLAILGLLVAGASAWAFWYLLPRNGQVHWMVTAPVLESILPLGLITGFALGVTMFISIFSS
jgi:hypothetical protein